MSSRLGDQLAAPLMHDARCWLERSRGRYERSLAAGRRAAELTVPGSPGPWTTWTRATLGWCLLEVRAHADAVSLLDHAAGHAEMLADPRALAWEVYWRVPPSALRGTHQPGRQDPIVDALGQASHHRG